MSLSLLALGADAEEPNEKAGTVTNAPAKPTSVYLGRGCKGHRHTRVFNRRGIRKALLAGKPAKHWLVCARSRHSVSKLRSYHRSYRAVARYRRAVAGVTPYQCGGSRWAIPCGIIACESGFSWSAYNSSSAAGPYQLMAMHGRPFPVRNKWDKLRHHQIAFNLYRGGAGRSAWVC